MPLTVPTLLRSLREAVLTLLAMLATLACTQWFEPGPASAVLGVVLALSLARSHLAGERRGRLEALVALPVVSLASVGVGELLRHAPWAGASVFVAAMAVSIWMRRFGRLALRAGSLIALPLVTLLVVPHLPQQGGGVLARVLVPLGIAVTALAWVTLAEAAGASAGSRPRTRSRPAATRRPRRRPARCVRRRTRAWRCRWRRRSPRPSWSAMYFSRRTGAGSC
jgi:hypothetical protein